MLVFNRVSLEFFCAALYKTGCAVIKSEQVSVHFDDVLIIIKQQNVVAVRW